MPVFLFSLSAGAFTLSGETAQDLSGMDAAAPDTIQNGCANVPVSRYAQAADGTPDALEYEVLRDGKSVFKTERMTEGSFAYTPEKGGILQRRTQIRRMRRQVKSGCYSSDDGIGYLFEARNRRFFEHLDAR